MPKGEKLTKEIRQRAASTTNKIVAERKQQRLMKVRRLLRAEKTPAEIARLLNVSERTIKRDLKELERLANNRRDSREERRQ